VAGNKTNYNIDMYKVSKMIHPPLGSLKFFRNSWKFLKQT